MNRLKLDFSIESMEGRNEFVKTYIHNSVFAEIPLTSKEKEQISQYILWGKEPDGRNCVQKKDFQLDTKKKTWNKKEPDSLDQLQESPTFNEAEIISLNTYTPTKTIKNKFDREKELSDAPNSLRAQLQSLFRLIDETDLLINFYEFFNGKRTTQPRAELLKRFNEEETTAIKEKSKSLTQFDYLKSKHQLVELRQQQYLYKDGFKSVLFSHGNKLYRGPESTPSIGFEIPVLPLGTFQDQDQDFSKLIFQFNPDPNSFSETQLQEISDFLITKEKEQKNPNQLDLTDPQTIYIILNFYEELLDLRDRENENHNIYNSIQFLLNTINFYIKNSNLTPPQKEILKLKIQKIDNNKISSQINHTFNKTYNPNYISTIYKQKIIKKICEAACHHRETYEQIFFPENFKKCGICGQFFLKEPYNFTRKSRATDGFSSNCKKCEKEKKEKKKEEQEKKNGR